MSDAFSLLPASVLRNLLDKLYEKRKNAALEVEGIVKQLTAAGDHEKISALINVLTNDFALSPQASHRKGGLIGLAAATVGLASEATRHLEAACETNEELCAVKAEPADGFDIGAVVTIARRGLSSKWEATRLEALRWMSLLLERHRTEVISFRNDIFPALLQALSDPSDEVVLLVLEVHACMARDASHFRILVGSLVHHFQMDRFLLEKRGTLMLRRLCVLLDAECVYREFSSILEEEAHLDFAKVMVQALNLILFTAPELVELRALLKQSLSSPGGRDLFLALYSSWCHSPTATISLCLLAQLLEPGRYTWLLKTLYGLLMLLPQQSDAFRILRTRLKTVPACTFSGEFLNVSGMRHTNSGNPYAQEMSHISAVHNGQNREDGGEDVEIGTGPSGINFAIKLQQFEDMQHQHRSHRKLQTQMSKQPQRSISLGTAKKSDEPQRTLMTVDANQSLSRPSWRLSQ